MKRINLTYVLLGLATAVSVCMTAHAQSGTSYPSGTLVLKKMYAPPFLLAEIAEVAPKAAKGSITPDSNGPTCFKLLQLYRDVAAQQSQDAEAKRKSESGKAPDFPPDPTTFSLNNVSEVPLDYLIINIVTWHKDASGAKTTDKKPSDLTTPNPPESAWYLLSPASTRYPDGKLDRAKTFKDIAKIAHDATNGDDSMRIYGSKKIGVLLVQRGLSHPDLADVSYTLQVSHKKSIQQADFDALVSMVFPAAAAAAPALDATHLLLAGKLPPPPPEVILAIATSIKSIKSLPDDLIFAGQAFQDSSTEKNGGKPDATFAQTYDDEGYSYWDISAGIPVIGIKDVQYTQTGSTITPKTVTRANAYGLAHFYPYKVDLKADYPWQPSLVAGLPLSGAPLDKPFVGIAIGTKKPFPFQVNVFAGAVFNKVFTSASTTDAALLNSHRVTKLLYGIDIPIGQLAKAIAGK